MASCIELVPNARLFMRPIQLYLLQFWKPASMSLQMVIPFNKQLENHLQFWLRKENLLKGCNLPSKQFKGYHNRCFQNRLRGVSGKPIIPGNLVSARQNETYQSTRDESCNVDSQTFSSSIEMAHCFSQVRQHNSCSVHKQAGEHQISSNVLSDMGFVASSFEQQYNPKNSTFGRLSEHFGGRPEQSKNSANRMVSEELCDPETVSDLSQTLTDLFASEMNCKTAVFCTWIPSQLALATDALSIAWENIEAYAFPPICLIPKLIQHMKNLKCQMILTAPQWARRPWYTSLLQMPIAYPMNLPVVRDLLTQPKTANFQTAWLLSTDPYKIKAF